MTKLTEMHSGYRNDAVRRGFAVALALTVTLGAACSLDLSGIPAAASAGSTSGGGNGAGSTSVSAASAGGAGGAGGASATSSAMASSAMASSGTTSPCTPTGAEICNDGIDNDCNMATDCDDPACAVGFVCIPAIPSGWSAVAFSEKSRPSCPGGYPTAVDVVSAPTDAATCACACTEQAAASCATGMLGIASMGAGPCPAAPSIFLDANGSNCGGLSNLGTAKNGTVKIAPLPPTQAVCNGTPDGAAPAPVDGRSCDAAAVGVGCANGGACVTSPGDPFVACIAHDGAMSCPPAFPNGSAVGTSATDTRSCTQCTCGTSATCSNPKLTFYSDASCSMGAHDLPVTSSCDSVNDGNGHVYKSYEYTIDIAGGECQTTKDSTPTGSLVLVGARTVCCQ